MRTGILLVNFNWSDVQSNTKFNMTTQFQTPPECPRDNTFQAFRSFVTLPSLPLPLPPMKVNLKVTQSCLPLCDPMNCTVHGILQARILEWVAISFSRGSSQPRSPALQVDSLPAEPQGKPHEDKTQGKLSDFSVYRYYLTLPYLTTWWCSWTTEVNVPLVTPQENEMKVQDKETDGFLVLKTV